MKTEQEQIEEMAKVLCDDCENNTVFGKLCKSSKGSYICECEKRKATALVQAGYGDVSEYKVEIERLKVKIERLEEETDEYISEKFVDTFEERQETYNYGFSMGYSKGLSKVKQAKIDVLNKVKEKCSYTFTEKRIIAEPDIDELIKEVQNEQQ